MNNTMGNEINKSWYSKPTGCGGQGLVIDEATGNNIAVAYDETNGSLIAAAPDMLATLRAIAADCEDYLNDDLDMDAGELCIAFLKAINEVHDKATGSCFVAENPVDEFGEMK